MWTRPYGDTGKEISVISFGGMRFADPSDIDASAEVVMHGYERGINYFDTAPGYCGDRSEDIIGAALRRMDPGTFYCSTKCGSPDGDELRKSLDRSLQRLGVEKIDFFHIWCITSLEQWQQRIDGGAVAAALRAKQEGLIDHVVVSSHLPGTELEQVLREGPFEGVLLGYCAINSPYRERAVEVAGAEGLGVVTMNPLGGGVIPSNAERFDFIRSEHDRTVVEAALRFNISNPNVTSALVGFSTKDHVDEAIAAVEGFTPYSADHIQAMRRKITDSFEGLCTGCGYCLPCPQGVPVPKLMDAYNQKLLAGEGEDGQAKITSRLKWHWGISAEKALACSLCGTCDTRCTQHLPVGERLKEIMSLAERE